MRIEPEVAITLLDAGGAMKHAGLSPDRRPAGIDVKWLLNRARAHLEATDRSYQSFFDWFAGVKDSIRTIYPLEEAELERLTEEWSRIRKHTRGNGQLHVPPNLAARWEQAWRLAADQSDAAAVLQLCRQMSADPECLRLLTPLLSELRSVLEAKGFSANEAEGFLRGLIENHKPRSAAALQDMIRAGVNETQNGEGFEEAFKNSFQGAVVNEFNASLAEETFRHPSDQSRPIIYLALAEAENARAEAQIRDGGAGFNVGTRADSLAFYVWEALHGRRFAGRNLNTLIEELVGVWHRFHEQLRC